MGGDCLTVGKAWRVYERWQSDPRVRFQQEMAEVNNLFRRATAGFDRQAAPKSLGDCYLLAFSQACGATLVTLDACLSKLAARNDSRVVLLP